MTYRNGQQFRFEQLEVYQAAREFRQRLYKLAAMLPPEEKFNLKRQMMGAAISITNNIAEGHGRYNWQDNTKFCRNARGSLCETIDDINVCIDHQYAQEEHLENLKLDGLRVLKLLNGYISYLQRQKTQD